GGVWQRQALPFATSTTRLCDITTSGTAIVIAGERDGHAAVWRLESAGSSRTDLDAAPLRGLAAAGSDLWAVGDQGTVLRYAPAPAPPPSPSPAPAPA